MEKQDNLEANVLLDNIADIHAKLITMNYILDDIVSSDIFTTNNYPELKNGNLAVNLNDLGVILEGAKCNIREICFPKSSNADLLSDVNIAYSLMVYNHCSDEIQKKMRKNIA
jgi:hypothetical protein